MKVLVTGGAGFIGSNFVRYVLQQHADWQVVNLDKLTYAGNLASLADVEENSRYTFIKGDISDRALVDGVFGEHKPDAVINFAAESHVDRSMLDAAPFVDTNIRGAHVLLEATREHRIGRFVQISTDEVYGTLGEDGVFTEMSPLRPNNPYSASKASAELLCRAYQKTYGVPVIITRSSNNYGPCQFPEKLIPLMIHNALVGKPLPVYGEGKQVRDWLFVEDNCRAIDLVLQDGRIGEVYNIGGSCEKPNIEVVELIRTILQERPATRNLRPKIQFIKDPRGVAHDFRYALDSGKIQSELHWRPKRSFESGLEETVEWYLANQAWVERVVTGEYHDYYEKVYGTKCRASRPDRSSQVRSEGNEHI
jgi:dTDP-glucose 4,6-dehydratase